MDKIRIVLAGGGTGGHLYPLVTVAKYIRQQFQGQPDDPEFLYIGPDGKFEKDIMEKYAIERKMILCGKMRRYFSPKYLIDFMKFPVGFFQALWHLLRFMPDVVFAKGGYASVPVVLAARIYRIPVLLHESDAVPGMANKFLGAISSKVAITYDRAKIYFPSDRTVLTGVPVKENALNGSEETGRQFLKMPKQVKPVVLVLGGSQGAKAINDRIVSGIDKLLRNFQIVHQTGQEHYHEIFEEVERRGYKIEHSDYYPLASIGDELKDLLALADIVVSRAGATFISEIAANGKPTILVPINQSANDHQRINAYELAEAKAAVVLEEPNFTDSLLLHYLTKIFKEEEFRNKLSANIKNFYQPEAAKNISSLLLELAEK